jgi:UDP-glucose 4-epimerase
VATSLEKKTVLITGGAGFIGSHLCERLVRDGHRVISLDNYFTGTRENHVAGVDYREGHTKDIEKHISECPDLIYHLGEYSRVEQSVFEPDLVRDLNIIGTRGVLDFWKKCRTKLVYAGSSTKFGDEGRARHTSPYARTKAENTDLVREIGEKEKLPYAIAYFYNVYGPRERSGVYGTVIEHFKRMYISGAPCAIVAPGTQTRNFTHVADIVDGLVRIGERGDGDEYGLGNDMAHSIIDVARMFGCGEGDIVFFPERAGNRMQSSLETEKTRSLGWKARQNLEGHIRAFVSSHARGAPREKRVLVFSTTLHPVAGPAEEAFAELARKLPGVHFDIVTTRFSRGGASAASLSDTMHVYRVGLGTTFDKFLLPVLGGVKGIELARRHRYLFAWSLMASYAALAGILVRRACGLPLLVTLADQNIDNLSFLKRAILRLLIEKGDQVYGTHGAQEERIMRRARTTLPRNSLGEGDAFANALRFAYADIVRRGVLLK